MDNPNRCDDGMITDLDHIGIAVNDLGKAMEFFEKTLGFKLEKKLDVEAAKVRIAFLKIGKIRIELLEPTSKESSFYKFLDEEGEGIHHIAFKVIDIEGMLRKLKKKGIVLVDEKPRKRAIGGKIAFLEPASTCSVPIELYEP